MARSTASTSLQLMRSNLSMLEGFVASTERLAEIVRRLGYEQEAKRFASRAELARGRIVLLRALAAQLVVCDAGWARLPDLEHSLGAYPPLTRREQDVTLLLLRGCSNRQIAQRLVISPGTAANHVARVLDKLGCRSRTQLVAKVLGLMDEGEDEDRARDSRVDG